MDPYVSIHTNNFNPFKPKENLLPNYTTDCGNAQFKLLIPATKNTIYILVVTTFGLNETGAFSVTVSGPNTVNFNRMSKYSNYWMNK
jgi:hypothetical protein